MTTTASPSSTPTRSSDLMRAQGYVHAQERFYEMDVRRHATAGRLAELFGSPARGERRVRPHDGLAPGGGAGDRAAQAGDPHRPGRLRRRGQRLSRRPQPQPDRRRVHLAGRGWARPTGPSRGPRSTRVAWLKAMAWDLRGNMADEIDRALALADHPADEVAELYPEYPYAENSPIVGQGAVVDGVFEPDATGEATRNPQRPAYTAAQRRVLGGVRDGLERMPTLPGPWRRHRQQQLGGRRRALLHGRAAARQRPASVGHPARGLDADGPALPGRLGRVPDRCRRLHVLRRPRGRDRPQRRDRLGVHQPRPRRHRPLPRAVRGRRPGELRRRDRADAACAPRRSRCAGSRTSPSPSAPPATARCSPTSPTSSPRVGELGRRDRPRRAGGLRRGAAVDGVDSRTDRRRHPRAQCRDRLGLLPSRGVLVRGPRAEPGVRRPRRPHRLPGPGPRTDPQVRQ